MALRPAQVTGIERFKEQIQHLEQRIDRSMLLHNSASAFTYAIPQHTDGAVIDAIVTMYGLAGWGVRVVNPCYGNHFEFRVK